MDTRVYHVFNKSIAHYTIFNDANEYRRMVQLMQYYQVKKQAQSFSNLIRDVGSENIDREIALSRTEDKLVDIVAYCLMPTHIHFALKPLEEDGISLYTQNILNSYTRYFNNKHKRRGPLWVGRTKRVQVESDEQLLHLTRYIHLNPVTAYLVGHAQDWEYSSYREYVIENSPKFCHYEDLMDLDRKDYEKFVADQVDYQQQLAELKWLLFN